MEEKSTTLNERFGKIPVESGLTRKMRVHQGWWRTNVLNLEPGFNPLNANDNVCNTILDGHINTKNFLTPNSFKAVIETLEARSKEDPGMIDKDRLFNNLLSSQPLCFNFFGEVKSNPDFGLKVLQTFYPDITKLISTNFEFAPKENYMKDRSAFDVAFEVEAGKLIGLIGFECKYTDTFSYKPKESKIYYGDKGNKNHDTYLEIYNKSKVRFIKPYYDFVQNKNFNQLFRNQLIAEAVMQNKKFDFVRTGLFYYQKDDSAKKIAEEFKLMLSDSDNFKPITYSDFISNVQQLELSWELREWTMLLWARYCGTTLSEETVNRL